MERGVPLGFGLSHQLSQNKFFDLSTPSMRKGCDGEEKKRIVKIAVHYRCASQQMNGNRLEHRPLVPICTG